MAEYNMPQYILREFKVTDARVSDEQGAVCVCKGNSFGGGGTGAAQTRDQEHGLQKAVEFGAYKKNWGVNSSYEKIWDYPQRMRD